MPKRPADQNTEQADLFGEIVRTSLPATVRRVIEASAEIMDGPPDRLAFLHSVLCQVGMPRRKIEERLFERTSGGSVLRIEAGALFNGKKLIDQPLPYGAKPRLIMVHIGSEAVRTSIFGLRLAAVPGVTYDCAIQEGRSLQLYFDPGPPGTLTDAQGGERYTVSPALAFPRGQEVVRLRVPGMCL